MKCFLLLRGGNSVVERELAAEHTDGMDNGEAVRIFVRFECGFMLGAEDGIVRHHEAVKLLPHQIRGLAAQHNTGTP